MRLIFFRCAISAFREGRIAFYKVVTENHHKPDLIRFLFKELSQLPINPTCANCLNEISKCKHGQLLSSYPGKENILEKLTFEIVKILPRDSQSAMSLK